MPRAEALKFTRTLQRARYEWVEASPGVCSPGVTAPLQGGNHTHVPGLMHRWFGGEASRGS